MIASLRGRPVARTLDGAVLDVGGVGYALRLTLRALRKIEGDDEVTLDTYLHVREDTLQLYGFAEPAEREIFEHLLSVSGVGPKVALAILSGSTPRDLRRAIALEDITRFVAIPGVGKKTAERICFELRDRLPKAVEAAGTPPSPGDSLRDDLVSALVNLGYHRQNLDKVLEKVLSTSGDARFEDVLRLALKELSRS